MTITLFTSNQARHLAFAKTLSMVAEKVFVIQECNTIFPGRVPDFFRKSPVMQDYFSRVLESERRIFGDVTFLPENVFQLAVKMGDLNSMPLRLLEPALKSDFYVVFGASFIKGDLCDYLVSNRAINIHMGVSPFYRGSSTNFWALYDKRPEYVGATIHLLTKGLDSGPILYHALPPVEAYEPFDLGMQSVLSAQKSLASALSSGRILSMPAIQQDKTRQLRYTRNADFTDEVALSYLADLPTPDMIRQKLATRNPSDFQAVDII